MSQVTKSPSWWGKSRIRFSGLLQIAVVLGCAITLVTFFASLHWLADLVCNLRLQIMAGMLLVTALCGLVKEFRFAAIAGMCFLANLVSAVHQLGPIATDEESDRSVRVMTVNVLTSNSQHQEVVKHIRQSEPDVVSIVELSPALAAHLDANLSDLYPHSFTLPDADGNFGIGLYSRLPIEDARPLFFGTAIASIEADIDGLFVIATHPLPPIGAANFRERNEQLERLAERVEQTHTEHPNVPIVVMGDFNMTPWSPFFDRFETSSRLRRARTRWGIRPTWYALPLGSLFGLTLDHVFVSESLACENYAVGPDIGSDHRSVSATLSVRKD